MLKKYLITMMMGLAAISVQAQDAEGLTVVYGATQTSNLLSKGKKVKLRGIANQPALMTISVNGMQVAEGQGVEYDNKGTKEYRLEYQYTFENEGSYEVLFTATADGKTVTDTTYFLIDPKSNQSSSQAVPPMGAYRNADGTVTFCLAAPEKESVVLVGEWNNYQLTPESVMDYVDGPADGQGSYRYFTKTVSGIPVNTPTKYYFYVNNGNTFKAVGDPYARMVLDPNNDKWISPDVYPDIPSYPASLSTGSNVCVAVFQDNYGQYTWKMDSFKGAPKDQLVIYELLFRDFTGTEGKASGNGTVRGAIEKIPYLKSLGINAVELLPIQEFDGNLSWGYNPNFYFALDKAYGTPQDYKEFIDICHQNGIAVILDVVFNQSAGLHPWYMMYDIKSNPFYNKEAPHAYSVLNDWVQEYPLVQQQWHDMLKFWLSEYKVDGFRFDLVKGLGDNSSYAGSGSIDNRTNRFNQSRVDRMKNLHNAMREVNPDAYFINELLGDAKEENEMAKDGELNWLNNNYNGCEFAMGWKSNLNSMWANKASRTPGSIVSYLESHDEERLAYKQDMYGATGIKGNRENSCYRLAGAAVQMLMTPGSHMIWQFSEMGNAQTTKSKDGGNDTGNKLVNWSLLDNEWNKGLVDRYTELINIRLANPDLFGEQAEYSLDFNNTANYPTAPKKLMYAKSFYGDKEIHVLINPGVNVVLTSQAAFKSQNPNDYQVLSKWGATDPVIDYATGNVTLPANGYVVIGNKSVVPDLSGVNDIELTPARKFAAYSIDGELRTVNASGKVEVWNLSGMKVAESNGDATFSLPAGIYLLRNGSESLKVMVK
ncbi:MAG: hypothetical protein K2N05_12595 [Muribaculaceae bacterium]|nr:hypothetical protein [Muribaculaceae bacterium]